MLWKHAGTSATKAAKLWWYVWLQDHKEDAWEKAHQKTMQGNF